MRGLGDARAARHGSRGRGGRCRAAGRLGRRQPARPDPRCRRRQHPAVRPPGHGAAERAGRAGPSTAAGRTRTTASSARTTSRRSRSSWRWRGGSRAARGTPAEPGSRSCSPSARRSRCCGALAFDVGRLDSRFGYVFDHATPIGEIVTAAPTLHRIVAEFHGRAAHAGVRPEAGRSAIAAAARAIAAMQLGRIDPETTTNVGHDPRRNGDQRGARALPSRGRGPKRRPRPRRDARRPR